MSFGGGSGSGSIVGSSDVVINTPANNEVLGYNSGTAKWQNQAKTTGPCITCDPRTLKAAVTMFPAANCTYYMRVQGEVVGATAYRIWVGTASGNISIANYANTGVGINAAPTGAPRGATGSVACPATGAQLVFASGGAFNVAEGDWIGLSCDNATASFGSGTDGAPTALYAGVCAANDVFPAGTPSAPYTATTPFFLAAEVAVAGSGTAPLFTAAIPPDGTVGVAYSYQFAASGTTPIAFTLNSGTIPAGLTLTSAGLLSGTPTTAATSLFTVLASNGVSPDRVSTEKTVIIAASGGGGGGGGNPQWLGDYQTGDFSQWPVQEFKDGATGADMARQQQIVTSPARAGYPYTAQFNVISTDQTSGDPDRNRSEVTDYSDVATLNGGTSWWAWSMYLPTGFHVDTDVVSPVGNGWVVCTQWHGVNGLPLVFGLDKSAVPHVIVSTLDAEWVTPSALPLGQWNDFVVGVTWSNTAGRLTVRINGTTFIDNAATSTLESGADGIAYFKQGIYRARSNQDQSIYYTGTRRGATEADVAL